MMVVVRNPSIQKFSISHLSGRPGGRGRIFCPLASPPSVMPGKIHNTTTLRFSIPGHISGIQLSSVDGALDSVLSWMFDRRQLEWEPVLYRDLPVGPLASPPQPRGVNFSESQVKYMGHLRGLFEFRALVWLSTNYLIFCVAQWRRRGMQRVKPVMLRRSASAKSASITVLWTLYAVRQGWSNLCTFLVVLIPFVLVLPLPSQCQHSSELTFILISWHFLVLGNGLRTCFLPKCTGIQFL